ELVPSMAGGVLLPLLVQIIGQSRAGPGRVVGNVYAANTLGALVGATITAQWLFPAMGVSGACSAALALFAVGTLLLLPWAAIGGHRLMLGLAAGTAFCAALAIHRADPRLTDMGAYLYGPS